jgi:hypothetical protein
MLYRDILERLDPQAARPVVGLWRSPGHAVLGIGS